MLQECSLREGRNFRKCTSRFRLSTGHFYRATLAVFIQQTIKNGLLKTILDKCQLQITCIIGSDIAVKVSLNYLFRYKMLQQG